MSFSITDCLQILMEKASEQNDTMSVNNKSIFTTATNITTITSTTTGNISSSNTTVSHTSSVSEQSTANHDLKRCRHYLRI